MEEESKRGGKRPGSGRKPLSEAESTVPVVTRMAPSQRDKLKRLGGAPWVRQKIDAEPEPMKKK